MDECAGACDLRDGVPRAGRAAEGARIQPGFYNLFLAIVTAAGIVVTTVGASTVGLTMVFVGTGSMVAAGLVLLLSSPAKAAAALKQLGIPLLAIIALIIGLIG